jgi:hypothetical protein
MSMSSPPVPTVTDPTTVANNQQDLNLKAMETGQSASNVNQVTPTGSLTYAQTGTGPNGVPTYTATQTLSPGEQALLTQMQGNQKMFGSTAGQLMAGANYGATDPSKVIGDATSGNTKALLGQETSYLDPYFKSQTDQLTAKLAGQGIYPGDAAYNDQMMKMQGNQNQAITGFLATAEPQAYQQAATSYGLPASMAESFMGMAAPAGLGLTSTPGASMNPADLVGATSSANTANMNAYNANLAQQNAMMSGLFGLGSAAISGGSAGFGGSLLGSLGSAALPAAAAFI